MKKKKLKGQETQNPLIDAPSEMEVLRAWVQRTPKGESSRVEARHFGNPIHRIIAETLWDLDATEPPERTFEAHQKLTQHPKLADNGAHALVDDLVASPPIRESHLSFYCDKVLEAFIRRERTRITDEISEANRLGEPVELLVSKLASVGQSGNGSVDAYYDVDRKEFLIPNREGRWYALTETQFKRWLRAEGYLNVS